MATEKKFKKSTLIKLFEALGFKTASTWDIERMGKKAKQLPEMVDEEKIKSKKVKSCLVSLMEADVIVVVDDGCKSPKKEVGSDSAKQEPKKKEPEMAVEETAKKKTKTKTKKTGVSTTASSSKEEAKQDTKHNEKKTPTKKPKPKTALKKDATNKPKTKPEPRKRKPGVLRVIFETIEKKGLVSKECIGKILEKKFPDRDINSMMKTVDACPGYYRKTKNVDVQLDKKGRLFIA